VDLLLNRISIKLLSCQANSSDSDRRRVGVGVGAAVGESVGFPVGCLVGCVVGDLVGTELGFAVGDLADFVFELALFLDLPVGEERSLMQALMHFPLRTPLLVMEHTSLQSR
jgi:hypothetical protein